MNVFISHSWMNKTTAEFVADSLKSGAEVWLDLNQLKVGDQIQPAIDKAIAQMDVVLVLWSAEAKASAGVAAEVATALQLNKKILPVLLDQTPREGSPLKGIYGVNLDPNNPSAGIFRITAAVARLMLDSLNIEASTALNDLTTFEGLYQYVQDYRNTKGIGGQDSLDWALRFMEQSNRSFQSMAEVRDRVGITLHFIQDTFAKVQAAGDNRAAIEEILNEVKKNPNSGHPNFKILISFIEGKLQALSIETKPAEPAPTVAVNAPDVVNDLSRKIDQASLLPGAPGQSSGQTAEAPAAPAKEAFPPVMQEVRNMRDDPNMLLVDQYIRSAPASLKQLTQLAAASASMSLRQVVNALHAYLANPADLLPDNQNGLLGFLDDAWLIHNTIYRSIEAGFFGADAIQTDWNALIRADPYVIAMIPAQLRMMLEQLLMQYLQLMANEVALYQPQFVPQTNANSYNAFMGYGGAVGGTSQPEKTIDDVFYTIGGKMYYNG
jgi:uncharacterized membrane protein YkvA (DUF1232 family)